MTDLVFKTSKMPVTGETLIAEKYEKYTGGKGANQAVAASRLGGNVEMIGKLGKDEFGEEHIEKLKEEHISINLSCLMMNQELELEMSR